MYCSKCGAQIPDDAVFCPKCGARVQNAVPVQPSMQQQVYTNQQTYQPQMQYQMMPERSNQVRMNTQPAAKNRSGGGFLKKIIVLALVAAIAYYAFPLVKVKVLEFIDSKFGTEFSDPDNGSSGSPTFTWPEGLFGNNGNNGDQGSSNSGSQGSQGTPGGGDQGSQGPSNNSNNGNQGSQGSSNSGNQGSQGSSGSGNQGSSSSGNQGSSNGSSGTQSGGNWNDPGPVSVSDFEAARYYLDHGVPSSLLQLAPYESEGQWKYMMIFENEDLTYYELGTCAISFGQFGTTMDLYPSMGMNESEKWPISSEEIGYSTFIGAVREDEVTFSDEQNGLIMVIGSFCCDESDSYAFGAVIVANGRQGNIILLRSVF